MSSEQRSPILRWLEAAPRWRIVALIACLIFGTGLADHFSGNDIAFTAIYLLPISLAAWFLRARALVVVVIACASAWLGVDLLDQDLQHPVLLEVLNLGLELGVFVLFGLLLSALRRSRDAERTLARTDALTGLSNRRAFWDAAEAELERCRRFGQVFTIAYFDVDDFKGVNDRHGHRAGDELLRAIAAALRHGVRSVDEVARLGGDEFALLLPGTGEDGARVVLAKLREHLTRGLLATFHVTCSIGCLTVLEAPPTVDELVARTDAVMYEAKAAHAGEVRHEVLPRPGDRPAAEGRRRAGRAG